MEFSFESLKFKVEDGRISIFSFGDFINSKGFRFSEVHIAGEPKNTHLGIKMAYSSEGDRLRYVSHEIKGSTLEILERSELIEVKTLFESYENTNAISVCSEIKSISDKDIILEEVSSLVINGIGKRGIDSADNLYFTRFTQSHHAECQPRRFSFNELGLFRANKESQNRIAFANIGSWSTKEELPQGIIEDYETSSFLMFQIESNSSWYYEIADKAETYYLYLGGANLPFGGWCKPLLPGESYKTVRVAISYGGSVNEVVGEMTKYRRQIAGKCKSDDALPTIFNEYMHLSWDSPTEENTRRVAPVAKALGMEYYVIDCGWHNEEDGDKIYPYIGQWKESKARFPGGVRAITDYIRSLGMKAGLWIEPEVIGIYCKDMLTYYDDSCFLQRNGRRLSVMGRHFLDFRNQRVLDYMNETIRRMVEDYGADYIKFDYNQDVGVGCDYLAFCAGEGLEQEAKAYLNWADGVRKRFPNVIFETCSSGGMRMDYGTLSHFSIVSTSDQTDYIKYPYIAGNVLACVLPEQAAVWSYPVGVCEVGKPMCYDGEWVEKNLSDERIAMNMINSLLGRMHLASHIELLSESQRSLVKEGVDYYNSITEAKKIALPYLPNGFCSFGDESVASGFETEDKIYLAVWALNTDTVKINTATEAEKIRIAYPLSSNAAVECSKDYLTVKFQSPGQAVFLEIEK